MSVSEAKEALTDDNFKDAIRGWFNEDEKEKIEEKYGNISDWNVSAVKNMKKAFIDRKSFNGDLSSWNVSSVVNMDGVSSNVDTSISLFFQSRTHSCSASPFACFSLANIDVQ